MVKYMWDTTKPDGTLRKLLGVSKIYSLGWKAKIGQKKRNELVENFQRFEKIGE